MATTEDAIVDRIRDVCVAEGFKEAPNGDFALVPQTAIDTAFTVAYQADTPIGRMGFSEEARGAATVSLARSLNDDFQKARRTALQDIRTLISAVIEDGEVTSGEYAIEDAGRSIEVDAPAGAAYLIARARLPLNFDADL